MVEPRYGPAIAAIWHDEQSSRFICCASFDDRHCRCLVPGRHRPTAARSSHEKAEHGDGSARARLQERQSLEGSGTAKGLNDCEKMFRKTAVLLGCRALLTPKTGICPLESTAVQISRRVTNARAEPYLVAPEVLAKARKMAPSIGLLAGVFGATVGVGGGVIIVPAIVSACKTIPQRLVSGTSLAAVLSTAMVSATTFGQAGCVDVTAALIISPIAMLIAPLGARATAYFDCAALRRILGYFLIAVVPLVPLRSYILSHKKTESSLHNCDPSPLDTQENAQEKLDSPIFISWDEWNTLLEQQINELTALKPGFIGILTVTGCIAGFASGLLGIGGGVIVTPLLALTLSQGQATVLGTSLLSMVPPSAAALLQHSRLGNVDWRMAAGLAFGTAAGGALGSAAAVQAPAGVLEACFAAGMLFLGRKTLQSMK